MSQLLVQCRQVLFVLHQIKQFSHLYQTFTLAYLQLNILNKARLPHVLSEVGFVHHNSGEFPT